MGKADLHSVGRKSKLFTEALYMVTPVDGKGTPSGVLSSRAAAHKKLDTSSNRWSSAMYWTIEYI
jgi:hypothetical protein